MNTIDKILIGLVGFLFGFTVTMIILFCIFQATPDVLIEVVFAACTSEAVLTFAIWRVKKKCGINKSKGDKTDEK